MKKYLLFLKVISITSTALLIYLSIAKIMHLNGTNYMFSIACIMMTITQILIIIDVLTNKSVTTTERRLYIIGTIFIPVVAVPLYLFNLRKIESLVIK